jgi:seryl-tRNA synthetase
MLDIRLIRSNYEGIERSLKKRGIEIDLYGVLEIDKELRRTQAENDKIRSEKNKIETEIARIKKEKKDEANIKELIEQFAHLSKLLEEKEEKEKELREKLKWALLNIPNVPHDSVPMETQVIRTWGEIKKKTGKSHYDIGIESGLIDFERGAKISGHRFTILWKDFAKLERALINYMLDEATKKGYTEVWVPELVNEKTVYGSGQLPKFEIELYKCERDNLYLTPTAEVELVNLHSEEILREEDLPLSYCAYTSCFRREAGEYGKDIKGLIRQHQFDKVELVKITKPEESYQALEQMVMDVEALLKSLNLPYRVIALSAQELGFSAAKTYDYEVWIPSQEKYREVGSASNCEDFQARRANIRYRKGNELLYVHTLNSSGLAVGRTLVAIVENFYDEERNIINIPDPLVPYFGKKEILLRK